LLKGEIFIRAAAAYL